MTYIKLPNLKVVLWEPVAGFLFFLFISINLAYDDICFSKQLDLFIDLVGGGFYIHFFYIIMGNLNPKSQQLQQAATQHTRADQEFAARQIHAAPPFARTRSVAGSKNATPTPCSFCRFFAAFRFR
jgi:hypothetical protein